ncbi:hypothetical protein A9Q74_11580 [Colwellia sp. 39_35_sub15_T18]|nr:hypothetical protein A9Q74_11580 [Colwellia sp. 39_35_sub15_T18]
MNMTIKEFKRGMVKLSEHGRFQLKADGNIIYCRFVESWNQEASVVCLAELAKCLQQLKGESIMMIVDSTDFEGGIEENYPLWRASLPLWLENGMTHFIRIDDLESTYYKMFVKRMDETLQTIFELSFAKDFNDAIKQAHSYGFSGFET